MTVLSARWRFSAAGLLCTVAATATAPAQTSWTQRSPANSPTPRSAHGLAYHAGTEQVVLFGGCDGIRCFGETWLWDGTNWTQAAVSGPTPRFGHTMAYDGVRDRVVLFGGGDLNSNLFGDTWEWDGTRWQQRAAGGPIPRWNHAMAYDALRQRTVMYGGSNLTEVLDKTWLWDGSSWQQTTTTTTPPTLTSAAMAWDGNSGQILMYSGWDLGPPSILSADTWAWDGQDWTWINREPGHTGFVPPKYAHSMAWDSVRDRVVMFGGTSFLGSRVVYFNDAFEWHRLPITLYEMGVWQRRTTTGPAPRGWAPLAFDAARERIVMFGGADDLTVFGDTYTYGPDFPAAVGTYGTGCAGSAGTPALSADGNSRPWRTESFDVSLSQLPAGNAAAIVLGQSQTQWAGMPLPLPLGPLAPGCSVLASWNIIVPVPNPAGTGSLSLPIPQTTAIVGKTLFLQGLVADPVNPLGITLSNGASATVGSK